MLFVKRGEFFGSRFLGWPLRFDDSRLIVGVQFWLLFVALFLLFVGKVTEVHLALAVDGLEMKVVVKMVPRSVPQLHRRRDVCGHVEVDGALLALTGRDKSQF